MNKIHNDETGFNEESIVSPSIKSRNKPQTVISFSACPAPLNRDQEGALTFLLSIIGIGDDPSPWASKSRRNVYLLAGKIFRNELPVCTFSAESLLAFTNFIDAMPKPGYIFQLILERETRMIIPKPLDFEIDLQEFLPSFRTALQNYWQLNCRMLPIGLFLLFFHRVIVVWNASDRSWEQLSREILAHCATNSMQGGW